MVDLLPRYHDVQKGEITIDGINIKDVKIHDLRSLIGNVNQEAILFNDTFFNNIAFGVENATMEQVVAAAKIANAHDFIMESQKDMTPISEIEEANYRAASASASASRVPSLRILPY